MMYRHEDIVTIKEQFRSMVVIALSGNKIFIWSIIINRMQNGIIDHNMIVYSRTLFDYVVFMYIYVNVK